MKKMKKKNKKIRIILPIIILIIMIIGVGFCAVNILPTSNKSQKVIFNIKEGDTTKQIVKNLKSKDLIKCEEFIYVYIKLNKISGIKAGMFNLNKNMGPKEIFNIITDSSKAIKDEITITFPEGKNMRKIAEIIESNTKYSKNDVFDALNDKEYIKSLISKYWFLTDKILDDNIYYPLEGYLAPNTYNFEKDADVKDIFKTLLDETGNVLEKNQDKIKNSKMDVHQVLTLASMVESEGKTLEDRKNIAGVFINRINANMPLGSDVTTYYASKIDLGDRDLYKREISSSNLYNTRSTENAGKLPIGPINNPSKNSIDAAINYTTNDYYYFVTDKTGKCYFSKNGDEHNKIINKLKRENKWFEY